MPARIKILVTGASGFTAGYLAKYLFQDPNNEIYFLSRNRVLFPNSYICDLSDTVRTREIIKNIRPDEIYHLAGSFTNDFKTDYSSNVFSSKNIFDALLSENISSRVLIIGSAAEYGRVKKEDNPVSENYPLRPINIYGLTKAYQTYLMGHYQRVYDMDIVEARTFNLLGKGAPESLLVGTVYKQIMRYKKGEIQKVVVRNVENVRDYIEVEKAVQHYKFIMGHGITGEVYNVGSGEGIKVLDLLKQILYHEGLTLDVVETIKNFKKYDIQYSCADISKLRTLYKHVT